MLRFFVLSTLIGVGGAAFYEDSAAYWIPRINSDPESTFTADYSSKFAGYSHERLRQLNGALPGFDETLLRPEDEAMTELPEKLINVRSFISGINKWQHCLKTITYIKEQACGNCWAVSTSEVVADRTCIANDHVDGLNKDETSFEEWPLIDFSEAQITECCPYCSNAKNGGGCSGGWPHDAMKYWKTNGIVTGGERFSKCGCQPYNFPDPCKATPACTESCIPGYSIPYNQDKHYAANYYTLRSTIPIMNEIYEHGPVVCTFAVYHNFFFYKSGVYNKIEGPAEGYHAIKIIGWGVNAETGQDYWIINNSWGPNWGMHGQVWFLKGDDLCNIEKTCSAAIAEKSERNFLLCPK